jgi:hypothetical protein
MYSICCVIVEDATDALHFNNLVISAQGATNPKVKKLPVLNYLYVLNFIFKYFWVIRYIKYCTTYLTFAGRNFPHALGK